MENTSTEPVTTYVVFVVTGDTEEATAAMVEEIFVGTDLVRESLPEEHWSHVGYAGSSATASEVDETVRDMTAQALVDLREHHDPDDFTAVHACPTCGTATFRTDGVCVHS